MAPSVITVKQINLYIKSLLEGDSRLTFVRIRGEISNFKNHFTSGHLYFTLKDKDAAIRCIMFKGNASKLKFIPSDSMQVVCTGRISVYDRDGTYQLYVDDIVLDGQGELAEALEKIKVKLEKEGLFDSSRKRKIPAFPKKIAVITSESGAAIKDILSVLERRFPLCEVVFKPALVQGIDAPKSLCDSLDFVYNSSEADVIIIGRGGGSLEDLWCFNDETLARKIAVSPIPVISAVGHETDFTICDFVSDLRAPTPSAAAELAVPDTNELQNKIANLRRKLFSTLEADINYKIALNEKIKNQQFLKSPIDFFIERPLNLNKNILDKISNKIKLTLSENEKEFVRVIAKLDALSPLKLLSKGYSVATKDNSIIKSVEDLSVKDNFKLTLSDGTADCTVDKVVKNVRT
ncbi:MAG: exodeoxyribonuclease VII large subunit [Clostridia bacterium]|nr:exodeoxyribonuclease VII large subunit [Clostridia bacterium]